MKDNMKCLSSYFLLLFILIRLDSFGQAENTVIKHLRAIGFSYQIRKINALIIEGSITVSGKTLPFTKYIKRGQGTKLIYKMEGKEGFQIVTGHYGWDFRPFDGDSVPKKMIHTELMEYIQDMEPISDFLDYGEKGFEISEVPSENITGTASKGIKLDFNNGFYRIYYFDPVSNYVIRTEEIRHNNGTSYRLQTEYKDFRKIGKGIVIAFNISSSDYSMTIDHVIINPYIKNDIFNPMINSQRPR